MGYKREESDALLKFLYDHLAYGADFQARVRWEKGTVVVWDVSVENCILARRKDVLTCVEPRDGPLRHSRLE